VCFTCGSGQGVKLIGVLVLLGVGDLVVETWLFYYYYYYYYYYSNYHIQSTFLTFQAWLCWGKKIRIR